MHGSSEKKKEETGGTGLGCRWRARTPQGSGISRFRAKNPEPLRVESLQVLVGAYFSKAFRDLEAGELSAVER